MNMILSLPIWTSIILRKCFCTEKLAVRYRQIIISGRSVARSLNPANTLLCKQYGHPVLFIVLLLTAVSHSCPFSHLQITFLCGTGYDAPIGLPNSKWASMSIHYTNGYPSKRQIQSAIRHYNDYGAIMMFDLRDHDVSETMNYFAPYIWEYRTVSWTGTVYPKDY